MPAALTFACCPDWYAISALVLGLVGMMMRNRLLLWGAAFACLGMLANLRPAETDAKQVMSHASWLSATHQH